MTIPKGRLESESASYAKLRDDILDAVVERPTGDYPTIVTHQDQSEMAADYVFRDIQIGAYIDDVIGITEHISTIGEAPFQKTATGIRLFGTPPGHVSLVSTDDIEGWPLGLQLTVSQPNHLAAQSPYLTHLMADENNRPPALSYLIYFSEALSLKCIVAHGKDLIDEENFRMQVRSNSECQPHVHTARIPLYRCVEKFFNLRKSNDLI